MKLNTLLTLAFIGALAAPSKAVPVPPNLLDNAGFETGTFSPWAHNGATVVSANPHTGGFDAKLGTGFADVMQTVNTTVGTKYTFSYDLASDKTNNGFLGGAIFTATVGGTIENTVTLAGGTAARPYQFFSFSYVATSATTAITFSAISGTSVFHIDDVFFGTPEIDPSACAAPVALILGGLCLYNDRRKRSSLSA